MDIWTKDVQYRGQPRQILCLMSDLHIEAADHDAEAFKNDLDTAARHGAHLSINGDLVDLILPSDRKRHHPSVARQEHDAIINRTTELAFEVLRPYVDLIDVISVGNHELATLKHHHYDITRAVITLLNQHRDPKLKPIHQGDYRGFQRYVFYWSEKPNARATRHLDIFRHHGRGGGAPVTKGMIDFNRIRSTFSADLYWIGHKHQAIQDNGLVEIGLGPKGKLYHRPQRAVQTPGYKRPFRQSNPDAYGADSDFSDQFYTTSAQGCSWVIVDLITSATHTRRNPTGRGIRWTVSDQLLVS